MFTWHYRDFLPPSKSLNKELNLNKFESYLSYYDETTKEINSLISRDCYSSPFENLCDAVRKDNNLSNLKKIEKSLEPVTNKASLILKDMKSAYFDKKAEFKEKLDEKKEDKKECECCLEKESVHTDSKDI